MDTKNPGQFDAQLHAAAQHVLRHAVDDFERPADALFAHVLAVVVMAQALEMPLSTLLSGVTAAYNDLSRPNKEDLQ